MLTSQILDIPPDQMNLDYTLPSGQAFRWKKLHGGWWTGVVRDAIVTVRHSKSGFEWQTYPEHDRLDLIQDYFRLSDDVPAIYGALAAADEHMAELIGRFRGLRMLRQDPTETLLSFICSAANSIPRISAAIEELSRKHGRRIASLNGQDYHSFPEVKALADADSSDLERTAGLGFRGRNLKSVAEQILQRQEGWLDSLRGASYEQAQSELLEISGVGRKIADCVCLFSLDKDETVPVDTHIRQLAVRLYIPDHTTKSITSAAYDRISGYFQHKFGPYAGWAQQFLFYEDVLRSRGKHAIGD